MATQLFSTGFDSPVTLGTRKVNSNTEALQDILNAGTVWGSAPKIQMLSGAGNYDSVFSNAITTTTGHDNAQTRALHLDVNSRPADYTQSPLLFEPKGEPGDFYMSAWMKLPDNLWSILGSGGWMTTLPEWKSAGDFRVFSSINALSNGKLAWNMKWDTNANGNVPLQTFWNETNTSVPVPQGEWFKVEFFTHRSNSDGRTWMKVNGATVFDHTGDNIGVNNAPINRIFLGNPYANKPADVWIDDVQIWDGVPTGATPTSTPTPTSSLTADSAQELTGTAGNDVLKGTVGHDVMKGVAGNDAIRGGYNNDKIWGGAGNDKVWGGLGNDALNGGTGRDIFVFNTKLGKTTNKDKVTDFNVKLDTLWLDNAVFKNLGTNGTGSAPAKLSNGFFTIGSQAKDENDYIVYNDKTGILSYDADGSGHGKAVEFAQLARNLKMTAADFFVV